MHPDKSRPPEVIGTLESALYVDDLSAAEAFYTEILGLKVILRLAGRHVFFRTGSSVLLLFRAEASRKPPPPAAPPVPTHGADGPGHYCLAVRAETLNEWRSWLEDKGVDIEADLHWPNGCRSIYIRDPAGNSIELADASLWG